MGEIDGSTFFFFLLAGAAVFFFVSGEVAVAGGLNDDALALISFKESIKDDPYGALSNWNAAKSSPCSWNGISCDTAGRVVSLSIPNRKLLGSISSLGSLSSVRHVNLRNNRISGNLSHGGLFAGALQSLVLSGNSIAGALPPAIGNLSYLQTLDLSRNSLAGAIPRSLLRCKRLKTLVLGYNGFSGELPAGFGAALSSSLSRLDLSHNRLSGPIPDDMVSLSGVQGTLDLSHNLFSGEIPASLGSLPEKVYIDLSFNNLSGGIPQSGALVNRGPTAFMGNPGLCGPPLKTPCSSSSSPANLSGAGEGNYTTSAAFIAGGGKRRLGDGLLIAIVAGDVVGICLIAGVFYLCYRRAISPFAPAAAAAGKKECFCFAKDESEAVSTTEVAVEKQHDLVPLDRDVEFDLEALLKSSAFVLGKGGAGILYKVVLDESAAMAVRRLAGEGGGGGGSQRFKEFAAEAEAIGRVRHPNIVALRAFYWSIHEKLLVYDFVPNGSLSALINHGVESSSPQLPWDARITIIRGVARGLAFLHESSTKKYVHGDLKPCNILLGADMEPRISDFGIAGLSRIAAASSEASSSSPSLNRTGSSPAFGTGWHYKAPESFKSLKPSQKWDVYSFGIVALELISGRSPADASGVELARWATELCAEENDRPLAEVLDPRLAGELDRGGEIFPVLRIALACVRPSPERRPSMRQVSDILDGKINAC